MSDSLAAALRLNNQGVMLMTMCDQFEHHEAVSCFTKSLNMVKRLLAAYVQHDDAPVGLACDDFFPSFHSVSGMEETSCFLYDKAIALQSKQDEISDETIASEEFYSHFSAVIIFNIALAYDQRTKNCNGDESARKKSQLMYSMVTKILCGLVNEGFSLVAKVAAINNLSYLDYESGRYQESQAGFHELTNVFAGLQWSDTTVFDREQLQGFALNVYLFATPSVAAAA